MDVVRGHVGSWSEMEEDDLLWQHETREQLKEEGI